MPTLFLRACDAGVVMHSLDWTLSKHGSVVLKGYRHRLRHCKRKPEEYKSVVEENESCKLIVYNLIGYAKRLHLLECGSVSHSILYYPSIPIQSTESMTFFADY